MWGKSLAVLMLCGAAGVPAATVPELRSCMEANLPPALRVQAIELTSYDRTGHERVLRGRVFGARQSGLARVTAVVEYPSDLAHAAFLIRETAGSPEAYLYLPTVNRVKRLAGGAMGGKLWGTDFSYSEFRQVQNAFAGGELRLEGTAEQDGRSVSVVALAPRAADPDSYDSIRVLVDRQTCLPLRAEFRRGGTLRKLMTAPAAHLQQVGTRWYTGEILLEDLAEGTRTRLRVLQLTAPDTLPAGTFQPQMFYSAH